MPKQADYEAARFLSASLFATTQQGYFSEFEARVFERVWRDEPAFEPGGQMLDTLQPVFERGPKVGEDELLDAGLSLGSWVVDSNVTTRNRIIGYLHACNQSDTVKTGTVGHGNGVPALNQIHEYAADVVAETLPDTENVRKMFTVLLDTISEARQKEPFNQQSYGWLLAKLARLRSKYVMICDMKRLAGDFYPGSDDGEVMPQAVDEQIALLTSESMKQRKYGTKPAYTEASIGGSWVFYDGFDYNEQLKSATKNTRLHQFAAIIFHSPHRDLKDLRLTTESIELGGGGQLSFMSGAIAAAEPDFGIYIGLDGSMTLDPEGILTLDVILKDKPNAAKLLKAEIASNFYDLSMPLYDNALPKPPTYASLPPRKKTEFNPIEQLLVPRIRFLHQKPSTSRSDVSREVREHDVTWYVRPLPAGWHASPDAIAKAAAMGIELGENETFVKAHKRGSDNKVLGYHAVRRMSGYN